MALPWLVVACLAACSGTDGTLYAGGRRLRAVRPDGTLAWSRALDGFTASPIIACDGTLYVTAATHRVGHVYALDPAG